jgi:probable HAF family extracellular repeat protein
MSKDCSFLRVFTRLIWSLLITEPALAQAPLLHYQLVDLGTVLGGGAVAVHTIFGVTQGYAYPPSFDYSHAIVWNGTVPKDLGTLGGPNSALLGGTSSGFSDTTQLDPLGQDFCEDGTYLTCLALTIKNGKLRGLPTLGGYNAANYDDNLLGQSVGVSQIAEEQASCLIDGQAQPPFYTEQGFVPALWDNGHVQTLPLLAGDSDGEASGINQLGVAVGYSGSCLNSSIHALLWFRPDKPPLNLGSLGGVLGSAPSAINNLNEVTGNSDLAGDVYYAAFLWRNGVMQNLGTLPGDVVSFGNSINDLSQIVGGSCDAAGNCRPFLWQRGQMSDLNTLVPTGSILSLLDAGYISDTGVIAGYALNNDTGNIDAYLAVPILGGGDAAATATEHASAASAAVPRAQMPALGRQLIQRHWHHGTFRLPGGS